jgi:signal transduction histidine kinase
LRVGGIGRSMAEDDVSPTSQDSVRHWLARELHDTVASHLTTMVIEMEQLKRQSSGPGLSRELERYQESTREVLGNLRRVLHQLRGEPCHVSGFVDSLGLLLLRFQDRTGIHANLAGQDSWPSRLAARASRDLLGIVDHALHNVRTHSAAHCVDIRLSCAQALATLTIADDGIGHDADLMRGGMGVTGMRERAALVGGSLRVESSPGNGTTVRAIFPLKSLV